MILQGDNVKFFVGGEEIECCSTSEVLDIDGKPFGVSKGYKVENSLLIEESSHNPLINCKYNHSVNLNVKITQNHNATSFLRFLNKNHDTSRINKPYKIQWWNKHNGFGKNRLPRGFYK